MRRFLASAVVASVVSSLALGVAPAGAAIITVTGTGDTIAIDGLATLREAITSIDNQADVNGDVTLNRVGGYASSPGGTPDVINFNTPAVGVQTIAVTSPLPVLTSSMVIDGLTQTGATVGSPLIQIDGAGAGAAVNGLDATMPVTLESLVVTNFTGSGIKLDAGSTGSIVRSSFIGIDPAGTAALPNSTGVTVISSGDTIGGTGAGAANVISGNSGPGVDIMAGSNLDSVESNLIGTNAAGTGAVANAIGVRVGGSSAGVGGTSTSARNIISGNTTAGVSLTGSSANVAGNYIGTNRAGTSALANRGDGVLITGAGHNIVGGTVAGQNVISGNALNGIAINASNSNLIAENEIGTNAAGTGALGNGHDGVEILHASANRMQAPAGHVILDSNNGAFGVAANVDGNFFSRLIASHNANGALLIAGPTPTGTLAISADRRTITGTLAGLTPGLSGSFEVYLGACTSLARLLGSGSAIANSTAGATVRITLPTPAPAGRVVGLVTGPATGTSPIQCHATPPIVSGASQSHSIWREASKIATGKRHKYPLGTTFSFNLNEPASVSFAFAQEVFGRKVNGKCVAKTTNNRNRRRCRHTVTAGTLSFSGHAGLNKLSFQGRISASRKLGPGRYTLVIVATASRKTSTPVTLTFAIINR